MPISNHFKNRLYPELKRIAAHFGTPFHIYDRQGIKNTCRELSKHFSSAGNFREFYAVKALPNPDILKIMTEVGFGFDCSSNAELILARNAGGGPETIMFTSNNTSPEDFNAAMNHGGCILNLDDISLLSRLPRIPDLLSFRYNPGSRRDGNEIIGKPEEAKYGVSHDQFIHAYRLAKEKGVKRFGLHCMLASNELNYTYMVETARMQLDLLKELQSELGIQADFINIGGGLGIPYRPEEKKLDIERLAKEITDLFRGFESDTGFMPDLFMESGRYVTGPHGVLVTTAINRKDTYRTYIGVDSSMSSLMRPGLYGSYHHVDVLGKEHGDHDKVVDITGSLCENNDKFAIQRSMPEIDHGDLLIIHDTGAHGHAMGFNYNGSLRPKELMLMENGSVELIRREETVEDYFATLDFKKNTLTKSR